MKPRTELYYLEHEDEIANLSKEGQLRIRIRFESMFFKEEDHECWEWIGPLYGKEERARFYIGNLHTFAARISYVLYKGEIGKLLVLHTCDNPSCVNPSHLWLGTDKDNAKDREIKGRGPDRRGENHGRSKLTDEGVKEIKYLLLEGFSRREVSSRTNTSIDVIRKIAQGKLWKHIEI